MITTNIQRQVSVNVFRPGDEADILAMNLAEYGSKHVMVTPDDFCWRYSQNPAGQTEITVARDEEKGHVVGFTWTIPIRMRLYGKDHVAALTANQLIHPEYRDTMVYARMSRRRLQWLRQQNIPFRFNFPIEAVYEHTGSIEKMSSYLIPLLIRPLDPVKLTQVYFKRNSISLPLGWGGKFISPFVFRPHHNKPHQYPFRIDWLDQFDTRFDDFWLRNRDKYPIMSVRDCNYLSWRFASVGERKYRIVIVSVDRTIVGYVVVRCTDEIRDIQIGLIVDFLLEPGLRGGAAGIRLMEEAWRYFKTERVWMAGGLALPHTEEYHVMRSAGYRALPKKWAPRLFRVAFNCFGSDLPETTQVKEGDLFMTIADYEAH